MDHMDHANGDIKDATKDAHDGVVAPCCNPLTLQPEQSGGRVQIPPAPLSVMTRGCILD